MTDREKRADAAPTMQDGNVAEAPQARWLPWAAVAMALAVGLVFQGSRGIFDTAEGRYAETARETVLSGDLDDPVLQGEPHWTKPPLTYFAIMGGVRVFGHNPWGVRAYLVLALVATVAAVGWAGAAIWDRQTGGLAALVAATSPFVAAAANVASTDMLLASWVAVALACFFHGSCRRSPGAFVWTGVALGLGFLTKGPIALLVPLSVIVAFQAAPRGRRRWRPPSVCLAAGVAAFAVVGLGWYVWEALEHEGLMAYWLRQEVAGRMTAAGALRCHNREFRYVFTAYLPLLLGGTGAWLPLVLWKGWPWRMADIGASAEGRAAVRALLCGILVPLAVLAFVRSKLPLYVTPLFVPLCILLGRMLSRLAGARRVKPALVWRIALVSGAVILAAKLVVAVAESRRDMTRLSARLSAQAGARLDDVEIFTLGSRPRYGLEFHLQRLIAPIPLDRVQEHLLARPADGRRHLYLVMRKDWARWGGRYPQPSSCAALGPHWLLVEWDVPPGGRGTPGAEAGPPSAPGQAADRVADPGPVSGSAPTTDRPAPFPGHALAGCHALHVRPAHEKRALPRDLFTPAGCCNGWWPVRFRRRPGRRPRPSASRATADRRKHTRGALFLSVPFRKARRSLSPRSSASGPASTAAVA